MSVREPSNGATAPALVCVLGKENVKLYVVHENGEPTELDVSEGLLLMEVLREFEDGLAALCGGGMSCGTCHVVVNPEWVPFLPSPCGEELEVLTDLEHYQSGSRLACQVRLTETLDGMKLMVAPNES